MIWPNALFPKVLNLTSLVNVLLKRWLSPLIMPFPMLSLSPYPVDHLLKNLGMIIGIKLPFISKVERSVGATKLLPKEGVPVRWTGPIASKKVLLWLDIGKFILHLNVLTSLCFSLLEKFLTQYRASCQMFTSLWVEGSYWDSRYKGGAPSSPCHRTKKWGSGPLSLGGWRQWRAVS